MGRLGFDWEQVGIGGKRVGTLVISRSELRHIGVGGVRMRPATPRSPYFVHCNMYFVLCTLRKDEERVRKWDAS